jgi:exodeoxyribonuclease V gamma subunit
MLGLNFDKFPRKDQSVSFDLMETKRQKGDRNIKENDKNLFLESLVAAEDYLYISYVGRNSKDNSDFPPSVLVDELVDYIQSGCDEIKVKDLLIKKHPLHGFSRLYNQQDQRLVTYLNTERQAATVFTQTKAGNDLPAGPEIPIEKLISFFKNPVKGYYQDVLKIYYNDEEVLLSENELFEIDSLEKWAINNTLLTSGSDQNELLREKMVKTGQLPLKNMGEVILENVAEEIADVKKLFEKCIGDAKPKIKTIEVPVGATTLKGDLKLYDQKLVEVCFSKDEQKYLIAAYIKYLSAVAAGLNVDLYFLSKENPVCHHALQIEKKEAESRLAALINLYQKGHETILPFSPEFDIKPGDVRNLTEETFNKKLKKKLESDYFPCTEPYVMSEFNNGFFDHPDTFENYRLVAQKILDPLTELFPNF